ncbi:GNAT family N-acetyltransferase [Enorma phocaeensis]|uniref:GNAT family N-acetyltransferase n=1 Tax=Enorma phocaeensis TaxID=1871019 RepID=UPI001956EB34|nr:GNAT family N-acetyltransferase [Enorma phocaeensis]MBM6952400.1 GNAT family N-acetyltransferase [Enorma phocaeensis]
MLKIDLMRPEELGDAVRLFVDAVHQINRADYAPEQLDAWAPDDAAFRAQLQNKLASSLTLAACDGDTLVGFGSLLGAGELDMLYVDPGHLRRGVGRALVQALEQEACRRGSSHLTAYASITARPFFESMGYCVVRENTVLRRGVVLQNFLMFKELLNIE